MSVYTFNNFFEPMTDRYHVYFNYTDGLFDGGTIPDHPGSENIEIGLFDVGDWVSLKVFFTSKAGNGKY